MNTPSFENRLRQESTGWVAEGIITGTQREALLARHPATADVPADAPHATAPATAETAAESHRSNNRFVAILGMIGGALLLTGICLVISSNWQAIGDWTKIGGLIALLIGSYAAGWRLGIAPGNFPRTGDACFMLGAGLLLAGIALVSQIFHLNSRPPNGVLVWWIGIAAVPWLVRSVGAQFLSLAAGLLWLGMEMAQPDSWLSAVTEHFRYYDEQLFFVFAAVYLLLGLTIWLAGIALRGSRRADFSGMHEKWGALLVCAGLYAFGFIRHSWRSYRNDTDGLIRIAPVPMIVVIALLLLAGWLAWRARSERKTLRVLAPGLFASALIGGFMGIGLPCDAGWLWALSVIASAVLFVLNILMIRAGLVGGRAGWVNLGIAFIALNIITRYIDLFGTMLRGGLFFIVTGILVIALGIFLERKRRAWIATVRANKLDQPSTHTEAAS